jgi:hypothetical protein
VLLGLLAAAAGGAVYTWIDMGEVDIPGHGAAAMGLGVAASLVVGIGLMRRVYLSHKYGYDSLKDNDEKG